MKTLLLTIGYNTNFIVDPSIENDLLQLLKGLQPVKEEYQDTKYSYKPTEIDIKMRYFTKEEEHQFESESSAKGDPIL